MPDIIKKLIAGAVVIIMSLYGAIGMSSNVSDNYTQGKYKNVILMIGDGMGENTIEATKDIKGIEQLAMEKAPVKCYSDIDSFLIPATDSAAGGTALSTGIRVWINSVAVFPFVPINADDTPVPLTLCELAKTRGMASGVVTTDETSGATPSDFSAHFYSRDNEAELSADQLKSGIDLIWGGKSDSINRENTAANGYTYVSNEDEMNALKAGSKSFAQFNFSDLKNVRNEHNTPTLEEMTNKAIEILDADEDGFFLMVEGACIDKFAHDNNMDGVTLTTVEFSKAVGAALDFAEKDGETLVIVTAYNATGGSKPDKNVGWKITHGTHDIIDVPVYVSAEDAGFSNGETVKNRQIAVQIARVLGFGEDQFPAQKIVE